MGAKVYPNEIGDHVEVEFVWLNAFGPVSASCTHGEMQSLLKRFTDEPEYARNQYAKAMNSVAKYLPKVICGSNITKKERQNLASDILICIAFESLERNSHLPIVGFRSGMQ